MDTPKENFEQKLGTMAIIFGISLFAVSFPSISQKTSFLPIPKIVFFIGKHFGTGVILSTAFVHLLKDSFEALSDPLVKDRYPGVSDQIGLIILGSLLLIFLVEYISTSFVDHLHRYDDHDHDHDDEPTVTNSPLPEIEEIPHASNETTPLLTNTNTSTIASRHSHEHSHGTLKRQSSHYLTSIVTNSPRHVRSSEYFYIINDVNHHINNGEYHLVGGKKGQGGPCVCVCVCPAGQGGPSKVIAGLPHTTEAEREVHAHEEGDDQEPPQLSRKRQIVGILVLQMGIMIHSLVIGLTLAITSGSEFATLTTAIVFHQLFEGLSLGIRIAAIPPPPSTDSQSLPLHNKPTNDSSSKGSGSRWLQPLLSILFAVTTPAGICLGILVFSMSGKHSEQARMLLTQGLMSAISAGMLIYAGTVEMLAGDFVFAIGSGGGHGHSHGEEFMEESSGEGGGDEMTWGKKVIALVSLCAGVAGMSLVGLGE